MYTIIAIIFIPLGAMVLIQTARLYSSALLRYDDVKNCSVGKSTTLNITETCTIGLNIEKNVTAPAYFYYGLVNFYQNSRTYVTSRSDEQLRGTNNANTGTCDPLEKDNGTVLVPCGLIANSRFNDTFTLCRDLQCTDRVRLNSSGIAWNIDRTKRFIGSDNYTDAQNALIRSEDFMVWMRLAAYRNWKKLYRIIDEDLPAGKYYVRIDANFPVESFDGEKFFFLSETAWFGGPNKPLGISYLTVGCIALVLAILFFIRSRVAADLDLPMQTTVVLDGLVKYPVQPHPSPPPPPTTTPIV